MNGKMTKRDYLLRATPCCGKKPLVYMRPTPHQFCHRCCRDYSIDTEQQIANWAWKLEPDGTFSPVHVNGDYVTSPGRAALSASINVEPKR